MVNPPCPEKHITNFYEKPDEWGGGEPYSLTSHFCHSESPSFSRKENSPFPSEPGEAPWQMEGPGQQRRGAHWGPPLPGGGQSVTPAQTAAPEAAGEGPP